MICSGCKADKAPEEFYRDTSRPRGRVSRCKPCRSERQRTYYRKQMPRILSEYRHNAKQRNIVWNLNKEEALKYWQKPCFYCGGKIETLGLDRIDNKSGYIPSNIVSCCTICNSMKSKLSATEFIQHCCEVAHHR